MGESNIKRQYAVVHCGSLPHTTSLLSLQGKYHEVEPLLAQSQAIREKMLDTEHPDVAESLINRAVLLEKEVRTAD